jgi:4-carboxymuconolactone decarboxylase
MATMLENVLASVAAVVMVVGFAAQTAAQDRMPAIPAGKMTEVQRKAVAEFKDARGVDISGPFVPLLRSPEVMNRARAMGDYLRFRSAFPPRLSEFVILLTARSWTQQYEWYAHYDLAIKAGVSAETARAIAEGRRPRPMTEEEEILYDFCDELWRNQSVSDATYARMVAKFGEQGVIDAVGIIGYYTMLSMVMNTTRTALPAGATPALVPLPR